MPKASVAEVAVRLPKVAPVPESGMLKLESEPVDVMLTLPLAAPLTVGANNTEKDAVWPGVSVAGKLRPLRVKPAPLTVAAEIVTLVPPELVRVSGKVELCPT